MSISLLIISVQRLRLRTVYQQWLFLDFINNYSSPERGLPAEAQRLNQNLDSSANGLTYSFHLEIASWRLDIL